MNNTAQSLSESVSEDTAAMNHIQPTEITASEAPELSAEEESQRSAKVGEEYLIGSSVQPSMFYLKDGSKITLADVVVQAFTNLKESSAAAGGTEDVTPEAWNDRPMDLIEAMIQDVVDTLDLTEGNQPIPEPEPEQPSITETTGDTEKSSDESGKQPEENPGDPSGVQLTEDAANPGNPDKVQAVS